MISPRSIATAAVMTIVAVGAPGAAAAEVDASSGGTLVPLSSLYRACSFAQLKWVSAIGTGSGSAVIGTAGDEVTALVRLATATPNTHYTVRLIQVPRPSSRTCVPGDPGVAGAELFTDASGSGTVALRGARMSGATGAWVSVDGPPRSGRNGEFYTSEIIASLG